MPIIRAAIPTAKTFPSVLQLALLPSKITYRGANTSTSVPASRKASATISAVYFFSWPIVRPWIISSNRCLVKIYNPAKICHHAPVGVLYFDSRLAMKDLREAITEKEAEIARLRAELETLRKAASILASNGNGAGNKRPLMSMTLSQVEADQPTTHP